MLKISTHPANYQKIDNYVSRSAQPTKENIDWLKQQGVTDIINFRTMKKPEINFNEEAYVKHSGMKYHNIPSVSMYPSGENVGKFLDIVDNIKHQGGKVHIHCKHGADRTGLYSYIYERLNHIGSVFQNVGELFEHKWHFGRYPDMLNWANNFLKNFKK